MKKIGIYLSIAVFTLLTQSSKIESGFGYLETDVRMEEQQNYNEYTVENVDWNIYYGCDYWVEITTEITDGTSTRYVTRNSTISLGNTWTFGVPTFVTEWIVGESVRIIGTNIDVYEDDANAEYFWYGQSCHSTVYYEGTLWDWQGGKNYQILETLYYK